MKGTTIIQRINPKTNEVIQETKEENYITDFPLKASNMCQKYLSYMSGNFAFDFNNWTKGLYLLADAQPEKSAGKMFLADSDTIVGYADEEVYSGADVLRGSYNALESGHMSPSKHRMVWDFGTNIAIGTVSALARVHTECVPPNNYSADNSLLIRPDEWSTKTFYENHQGDTAKRILSIHDNHIIISEMPSDSDATNFDDIRCVKLAHNSIGMYLPSATPLNGNGLNLIDKESSSLPVPLSVQPIPTDYVRLDRVQVDKDYIYIAHFLESVGFKVHRYSTTTGLFVDELTFSIATLATPYSLSGLNIFTDKLFYSNGHDLHIINRSDMSETVMAEALPNNIESIFYDEPSDEICVANLHDVSREQKIVASIYTLATQQKVAGIADFPILSTYYSPGNHVGTAFSRKINDIRFFAYWGYSQYYHYGYNTYQAMVAGILTPKEPLVTINNLASPVVKGANELLKVIYEFEW